MVWSGSQSLSAGVAVNVHNRGSSDYSEYRVSAGHSHGPPTAVNALFCGEQTYYVLAGDTPVLVHNCGTAADAWANKVDFSDISTLSKKYDAHAADFLQNPGNQNKANLATFQNALTEHMTAPGTKIFRFNYRGQGQAVGFIDSATNKMVMLRADSGKFWTAYRLGDNQFSSIVQKGYLW
jgi:hypothetical protein